MTTAIASLTKDKKYEILTKLDHIFIYLQMNGKNIPFEDIKREFHLDEIEVLVISKILDNYRQL